MNNWYHFAKFNVNKIKATYCAWCKSLIEGDPIGHDADSVSHGLCDDCKESLVQSDMGLTLSKKNYILAKPNANIKLFRGENGNNGNYYTTDKEWARQFTHSGKDSEIKQISVPLQSIYKSNILPQATNEASLDLGIEETLKNGFNALWVDEGKGQPNSVYFIDRKKIEEFSSKKSISEIAYKVRQSLLQDDEETLATLCLPVSRHLAQILINNGYSSANVVQGTFRIDNPDPSAYDEWDIDDFGEGEEGVNLMEEAKYTPLHYWVQVNNIIVDITADQFNDELESTIQEVVIGNVGQLERYTVVQENFIEPKIMYPWAIK